MARIFPKIDGVIDSQDFGPLAHPPFVLGRQNIVTIDEKKRKE